MDRKKFLKAVAIAPFVSAAAVGDAERLNDNSEGQCKTHSDAEGPYYKGNSPMNNVLETEGTPLRIEGKVLKSSDCQTPIGNATLDIWHCKNDGNYDMEGFKGRGQVKTDSNGAYSFTTIFPPAYGSRPRHIHFKIRGNGYNELTTQLYFEGDPKINSDFARNAEKARVIVLTAENGIKKGVFNIYL
jgi:catechol 1,2-dioxygenase